MTITTKKVKQEKTPHEMKKDRLENKNTEDSVISKGGRM